MKLNNPKLTPKQNNFCLHFLQCYNATKAYRMAYPHVKYTTAQRDGHRLMRNDEINRQISKLRKAQSAKLYCDKLDVIRRLLAMFFADVSDYVKFGNHPTVDKNGNHYQRSYIYFKDSDKVDTSLIQSVTNGKDGSRIELPNKVQLATLLLHYLPSPRNTNIHHDTLVVALKNGMDEIKNHRKHKKQHRAHISNK